VYFIGDRFGRLVRGSKKVLPYQEFWVFRRCARPGAAWRLQAIQQSHESNRLAAENHVTGLRDLGACQAGDGVILL
jgi:hypothetical protein